MPKRSNARFADLTVALIAALFVLAHLDCPGQILFSQPPVISPQPAVVNSPAPPTWTVDPPFQKDVFTFARIRYSGSRWAVDYPDSDLNFSYRLQQMTSLKVNPRGVVLNLTDKDLFRYPWIYIVEPGDMQLSEIECASLRRYLLNGGFLMVDDFWGEAEWRNFYANMKRVFPEREPVELPLSHPIYHCVFDIKSKGQVPAIDIAVANRASGVTWELADAREVHHRAYFDDQGRLMVIITHNTDNGDGWEREGENEWYFRTFSEKIAYPLGINIVFYAMTH
jgi:hypothetical protein